MTEVKKGAYLLVDRSEPAIVETFETYDAALAAWAALDGEGTQLAVRSEDDPAFAKLPVSKDRQRQLAAIRAVRVWTRKEVGATALATIKANPEVSFNRLVGLAKASLIDRGIKVQLHEVTEAVKARVVFGRCRSDRWGFGCNLAFWMPKSAGRLADAECPRCKRRLAQSTLALGSGFESLVAGQKRFAQAAA